MLPNIIYIHSHDTGRYIQPYGHAVPTPHLQHLAEEGILFRKAFCAAPTCSPSRAALLTGQSPHTAGMLGLAHRGFSLKDMDQHIVHFLKEAGYETILAGVQHVARHDGDIGYETILDRQPSQPKVNAVVPAVEQYLRNRVRQNTNNRPFFLDIGFVETHREYPQPSWAEDDRYTLPPAPLPDTPQTRKDMAAFKASAARFDQGVGIVIDLIDELNLAENTLVICTTDHGIAFPGMKCNLTDHGIGTMLIMRGPGGFEGGKVIDSMISQIDLFPTICDIINLPYPSWLQGKSFLPIIRGEIEEINTHIFAEVTYHAAYEPMRAIRTQQYKYIERFDDFDRPVLPNCDDSASKEIWLKNGWMDQMPPSQMLFDLIFDPNETHNLMNNPVYEKSIRELQLHLHQWMQETGDPLLIAQPVPAPFGAIVNQQSQRSPNDPLTSIK